MYHLSYAMGRSDKMQVYEGNGISINHKNMWGSTNHLCGYTSMPDRP
jgi:hypothetical protein